MFSHKWYAIESNKVDIYGYNDKFIKLSWIRDHNKQDYIRVL